MDFLTNPTLSKVLTNLASLGIIVAIIQLYLIRRHVIADHERSRREKAVDLLCHFDRCLLRETSMTRKLIEKLDEKQILKIYNQEKVEVDKKLSIFVEGALGDQAKFHTKGRLISLNERQSSAIRWSAVQYLNLLESVLVAWLYSVADKDIIKIQLGYIYNPQNGEMAMTKFRTVAGIKNFPAIAAFIQELEENNKPTKGKKKIL
jgi:hypothetical protein